jgi:DNA invertase Pin-like site-specific DNA recombinase
VSGQSADTGAAIALAKKAGVYKGRKPSLTAEQAKEVRRRPKAGKRKTGLAAVFGVSRGFNPPILVHWPESLT